MKVVEAMKRVKLNKQKIADLQAKLKQVCANLSHETPLYPDTSQKVREWLQSCRDLSQENVRLLCAIARTNLATSATICVGGQPVTKTVAEWVWRRREYANLDLATWSCLTDRGLKEGQSNSTTGVPFEIKIIRHYDPAKRDEMVAMFKAESYEINSALEVVNAITDLIEA